MLANVFTISLCVFMCVLDFASFGQRRNLSEAGTAVDVLVGVVFSAAPLVVWTSSDWRKSHPHQAPLSPASVQILTCPMASHYYIQENGSSLRKLLNSLMVYYIWFCVAIVMATGCHVNYTHFIGLLTAKGVAIRRDVCSPAPMVDLERRGQHLSLHVPQRSHSSASSSEENSSSSAALPLLAGERESPSPSIE